MANQTLNNVTIVVRKDTAERWATSNYIPAAGEMVLESNTGKFKFGDGSHKFSEIEKYAGVLTEASNVNGNIKIDGQEVTVYTLPTATTTEIGGVKSATATEGVYAYDEVAVDSVTGIATVARVSKAKELESAFTIDINGDGTGSTTTKGTGTAAITFTLNTQTYVTAGTNYTKVRVNEKGIVVGADEKINLTDIIDIGSAASLTAGNAAGNVPILDSNGKLAASTIPVVATNENVSVADATARFALTKAQVQNGDFVSQANPVAVFMVIDDTKLDSEAGYARVVNPAEVISVNGKTGAVVLDTDDVSEGSTNLYFTNGRATVAAAAMSVRDFSDGSHVLYDTDTIIINGGDSTGE